MNQQLKKLAVLLVSKKKDHTCLPFMQQIRNQFPQHTYLIDDDYKNEPVDLVITIGGDGTILQSSKTSTPPFVTFGKGTLGFMCIYSLRDQYEVLKNLQSPYNIELKKRIQGSLNGQYVYTALNDFFITKGNSIHVVCLDIYVNDTFVTQARGGIFTNLIDVDGLIISTPTGSTAYCLSAGGPLIQNRVPCIALVPICPLSLSFRPLILPLDVKISIKMNANSRGEGVVICDGQVQYDFKRNDCFDIIPSQNDVRFVVPPRHQDLDWVIKLQRMLNWNSRFQQPRD